VLKSKTGEITMLKTNRLFLLFFLLAGAAAAQTPGWNPSCPYTAASLKGTYAVVITYANNVGLGLQMETFDGNGNITRTGIINQPADGSSTGARNVTTATSNGTYTVNCNGTGTITRIVTRADGTTAPGSDDFIITAASKNPGQQPIATTITDVQREPSVILSGGVFVTRVHTRLPDPYPASN
jgi:hypothetical protein